MSGTIHCVKAHYDHFFEFSQQPYDVGAIPPNLQIGKLRHREGRSDGQGCTLKIWKSEGNWNPVLLLPTLAPSPNSACLPGLCWDEQNSVAMPQVSGVPQPAACRTARTCTAKQRVPLGMGYHLFLHLSLLLALGTILYLGKVGSIIKSR